MHAVHDFYYIYVSISCQLRLLIIDDIVDKRINTKHTNKPLFITLSAEEENKLIHRLTLEFSRFVNLLYSQN